MAHIDTLKTYECLIASGIPENQAKAQVYALESSFDGVATKSDLVKLETDLKKDFKNDLKHLERDLKYFLIKTVASAVFITFILPIFTKKLGWS